MPPTPTLSALTRKRIQHLKSLNGTFQDSAWVNAQGIDLPGPKELLAAAEHSYGGSLQHWNKESVQLISTIERVPSRSRTRAQLRDSETQFNLQYDQLLQRVQHESRQYTAISHIMATKRDAVLNSITNVR